MSFLGKSSLFRKDPYLEAPLYFVYLVCDTNGLSRDNRLLLSELKVLKEKHKRQEVLLKKVGRTSTSPFSIIV